MNAANVHQIQNALVNVIERLARIEAMLKEVIDIDDRTKSGAPPSWARDDVEILDEEDVEILGDAEDAA